MNVQVIRKDGQPEFVVIPYPEYKTLLAAAHDKRKMAGVDRVLAGIDSGEETFPIGFVEKLVETDSRLREWRCYRGLTQSGLAASAGVSQAAIAGYESGRRVPNMDTARRIADALECDLDDLF